MEDLLWVDVYAQHKQNTAKNTPEQKNIQQLININDAVNDVNIYLSNQLKDLFDLDEYKKIFGIYTTIFKNNTNNLGNLIIQCDKRALRDFYLSQFKNKTSDYQISLQKPTNDLELYEWIKGSSLAKLPNMKTVDNNFASGFCTIQGGNNFQDLPFNVGDRSQWIKNVELNKYINQHELSDLYIFTSMNSPSDIIKYGGVQFHFVPATNQFLSELHARIQDNHGFAQIHIQNKQNEGPVEMQDMIMNNINTEQDISQISGADRINIDSKITMKIANVLDRVNVAMSCINQDNSIRASQYSFSQPHASVKL